MSLLGAILAGGRSTRMGSDKSMVRIGERTMLDRVAGAISAVADQVVVVGSAHPGFECWPDEIDANGPLAGIATALDRSIHSRIVAVAVDNAFVSPHTLERLVAIDAGLPVVPVDDHGVRQVTCAVYPRDLAPVALEEAAAGGSIQSLLDRASFIPVTPDQWAAWGEDGRSWFSVDSPESIQAGIDKYGAA